MVETLFAEVWFLRRSTQARLSVTMPPKEWKIEVRGHPGSSSEDVRREPDWGATRHDHYLGYRNLCGRRPGITNTGDDHECTEVDAAWLQFQRTKEAAKQGKLVNFQDAIKSQKVCLVAFAAPLNSLTNFVGLPFAPPGESLAWLAVCP